jgi:hypothetical protein
MIQRAIHSSVAIGISMVLGGCQPLVLDPGAGGSGGSSSDGETTASSGPGGPSSADGSFAIRSGDVAQLSGSLFSLVDGDPARKNDILFAFDGQPTTCDAIGYSLDATDCPATKLKRLELAIPPELFHVGKIDLRDRRISSGFNLFIGSGCNGGGGDGEGGDGELSCDRPFTIPDRAGDCSDADGQQVIVILPPELDHGESIDLSDPRVLRTSTGWRPHCEANGQYFPVLPDTLKVGERDAEHIDLELSPSTLAGSYRAAWCGSPVAETPPTAAIAVDGKSFSDGDPDSIYLLLGVDAPTCDDFKSEIRCSGNSRTRIGIPIVTRAPTTFALAALDTHFEVSRDDAVSCTESDFTSGRLSKGSLEVTSGDGDRFSIRITGSYSPRPGLALDGIYAVERCR